MFDNHQHCLPLTSSLASFDLFISEETHFFTASFNNCALEEEEESGKFKRMSQVLMRNDARFESGPNFSHEADSYREGKKGI